MNFTCIQDTLSSRAALGLPAFRPSASREQRYLAYKNFTIVWSVRGFHLQNDIKVDKLVCISIWMLIIEKCPEDFFSSC